MLFFFPCSLLCTHVFTNIEDVLLLIINVKIWKLNLSILSLLLLCHFVSFCFEIVSFVEEGV